MTLLAAASGAMPVRAAVPSGKIISLINEFQSKENFEVVKFGALGTSVVKAIARSSAFKDSDKETRDAMSVLKGIKRVAIVEYEDSAEDVRSRFTRKLDRILANSEILVEAKDKDDIMRVYGVVNSDASLVKDVVIYVPSDCTLICLFGSVPMDSLNKIIAR